MNRRALLSFGCTLVIVLASVAQEKKPNINLVEEF